MHTEVVTTIHADSQDFDAPPWIEAVSFRFESFTQAQAFMKALTQLAIPVAEPSINLMPLYADNFPAVETPEADWQTFSNFCNGCGETEEHDPTVCADWYDDPECQETRRLADHLDLEWLNNMRNWLWPKLDQEIEIFRDEWVRSTDKANMLRIIRKGAGYVTYKVNCDGEYYETYVSLRPFNLLHDPIDPTHHHCVYALYTLYLQGLDIDPDAFYRACNGNQPFEIEGDEPYLSLARKEGILEPETWNQETVSKLVSALCVIDEHSLANAISALDEEIARR